MINYALLKIIYDQLMIGRIICIISYSQQLVFASIIFFPGFISLKVYDLLIPNEKRNFSHDFLEAVSYSILNLSLLVT